MSSRPPVPGSASRSGATSSSASGWRSERAHGRAARPRDRDERSDRRAPCARGSRAAYPLRALNRRDIPGVPCHRADIADLAAIEPAFRDIDVVVHLAAAAGGGEPWESILRHNLVGTYNVFEAARRAGVKRVIFASSGATVTGYEREEPYASLVAGKYAGLTSWPMLTHETPLRPAALYGVSKAYGEALGRQYADEHGLSVLCHPHRPRQGRGSPDHRHADFSVWLSQRDVVQILERAITAPADLRYGVFFATSDNRWGYRDLAPRARRCSASSPRTAPRTIADARRAGPTSPTTRSPSATSPRWWTIGPARPSPSGASPS